MSMRALVTGATGFVGRHLVRRLTAAGVPTRVLVRRRLASAAPFERPRVEIVRGDVTDPRSVREAALGCDVVFHCAWGGVTLDDARRINVDGTRAVVESAAAGGARRVVHLSSMAVHGPTLPAVLDERAPLCTSGDAYGISKAEGETVAFAVARAAGVELVALRPPLVYGPGAPLWVLAYFERVKNEQVVLIDGGVGLANLIAVDDLVDAMLAAAAADADGEAFLVSGPAPVTWREYLGAFAAMLGKPPPPALPAWRAALEMRWQRVYGALAERPARIQRTDLTLMSQRTVIDCAKARARLGYRPRIDFIEGMRRCEAWLRREGHLPHPVRVPVGQGAVRTAQPIRDVMRTPASPAGAPAAPTTTMAVEIQPRRSQVGAARVGCECAVHTSSTDLPGAPVRGHAHASGQRIFSDGRLLTSPVRGNAQGGGVDER